MGVRLLHAGDVDRWRDQLARGLASAARAQHATIGRTLRAYGLSWDTAPMDAPATLWDQAQWAEAVNDHFTPVARKVAADMVGSLRSRVSASTAWGAMPTVDDIVNIAVERALAGGPQIGRRVTGTKLTASAPPPLEFRRPAGANPKAIKKAGEDAARALNPTAGTIIHPEAARTIADEYAMTIAQLEELTARSAGPMANAATEMLSAATETTVILSWHCSFEPTSREDHEDADGQTQVAGEPFDIGGEALMYPGDPSGSDEQTANCLCWLEVEEGIEVVEGGGDSDVLDDYDLG